MCSQDTNFILVDGRQNFTTELSYINIRLGRIFYDLLTTTMTLTNRKRA